ncbi:hypothetical protein Tco_0772448 [Tanacetum coccineum]|uniref:Uncharacterized protein n=1 Tax=Tanacetum coccineum TaxID=301880 RepID=A0ABQ4ZKV4_9ASTR
MAESSSQNPSSPEITPKEEPDTLDKPKSLNLILPASQVDFTFDEITFTTNNEVDYAKIIWEDLIHKLNKKTREKIVPYPSVHNLTLKPNQPEEPLFTDHMKAIYNLDLPMDSKAPKPSSQTKEVPKGKKPGSKSGLRRKQSSKHTSESKTKASKSKTGQSEKDTQSSSAKDKSPSHPSPPTPVVGEMHKEAQQAVGGPTSLGATSEEGAHPQLSSGMSTFKFRHKEVRKLKRVVSLLEGLHGRKKIAFLVKRIKQSSLGKVALKCNVDDTGCTVVVSKTYCANKGLSTFSVTVQAVLVHL